jgi:hypothetical protein
MSERRNTMVCSFERDSPRITALEIHDWIDERFNLPAQEVQMVQIDGPQRKVYIKVRTIDILEDILERTSGSVTFAHKEGVTSKVTLAMAGLGFRRLRIANLPPELSREITIRALEPFGKVEDIKEEMWSRAYRYHVSTGVLLAQCMLTKHVPSHLTVGGYRALISYEGQPITCYACNNVGHLFQHCPSRQRKQRTETEHRHETWATLISREEGHIQEARARDPTLERSPKEPRQQNDDNRTAEAATKGTAPETIIEGHGAEQMHTPVMDEQEPHEHQTDGETGVKVTVEAQTMDIMMEENKNTEMNGELSEVAATSRRIRAGRKERESCTLERKDLASEQGTPGIQEDDFPQLQASEEEENPSSQNKQSRKKKRTDRLGIRVQSRSRSRSAVRGRISDTSH